MAETYYPFDAGSGSASGEDRWYAMAPLWAMDGVTAAAGLAVTTLSGRNLQVATGSAWVHGAYYTNDAAKSLAIAANASGNPRIDRVVLRRDLTANTVTAVVVQGTAAASPSAPALTQVAAGVWEVPLAQYRAESGFVNTDSTKLFDERLLAGTSALRAPVAHTRVTSGSQATSSGAEALWAALQTAVVLVSGRKYRLTLSVQLDSVTASTPVQVRIRNSKTSSAPTTSSTAIFDKQYTPQTFADDITWVATYTADTTGTNTLGVSVARLTGSGEVSVGAGTAAELIVDDITA